MIRKKVIIIGAGPAGLMAAEILSRSVTEVTVYERKPSAARKFLMAGRGGLNITHSEDVEILLARYREARPRLEASVKAFTPQDLRTWCHGLGEETFTGSSGRVFPKSFKASPLLRAWLKRLAAQGVTIKYGHDWRDWSENGEAVFQSGDQEIKILSDATLLAMGGASWPNLGSDGSWVDVLKAHNISIAPLKPANCGFTVNWSDIFKTRFAGQPLKTVRLSLDDRSAQGDAMITERGIEGGPVYALSADIRERLNTGPAVLAVDLRPNQDLETLTQKLSGPRRRQSFSTYLEKRVHLSKLAINLIRETVKDAPEMKGRQLAQVIKSLPLEVGQPFPIERAISSAGGIMLGQVDDVFMLKNRPGVFAAGEMLDWEAPTGGYLLQACFATGKAAAEGIINYLKLPRDGAGDRL